MKIQSIADIPEWFFYPLKQWCALNNFNFNLFVGLGSLLSVLALIWGWRLYRQIGPMDERTNTIYLTALAIVLTTLMIGEFLLPKTYLLPQFTMYKYDFALVAGDLSLWRQYRQTI
ncbi:DUF2178 domain-containing protein [Furfurilactobacillus curtus]|uniref:Uncharacterized protein n=1 Tax=Furfurilactobacillus curtus TaxID=1746200 RepID=A0ABQ5JQ30_9LACO